MTKQHSNIQDPNGASSIPETRASWGASAGSSEVSVERTRAKSPPSKRSSDSLDDATDREVPIDASNLGSESSDRELRTDTPEIAVDERIDIALSMQSREETIRLRAYEIYLARSQSMSDSNVDADDGSLSDWLAAEREVLEQFDATDRL